MGGKLARIGAAFLVVLMVLLSAAKLVNADRKVVIVGGGIAGLSAARYLTKSNSSTIEVMVLEARRERYGGRVWTDKLNNPRARGAEVELGAFALLGVEDNPLLKLARKFELETVELNTMKLIFPSTGKSYSETRLQKVFEKATEVMVQARKMVQKYYYNDRSVTEAVDDELSLIKKDKDLLTAVLHSMPSYVLGNYSMKLYSPARLDAGFNTVIKDGMGELVDRLVSGVDDELPLDVRLHAPVRQIKVDKNRKKVLVRMADRSQIIADQVIIAVPLATLRSEKILFEPQLPVQYQQAIKEQGLQVSNKVVVEFEGVFWPEDVAVFVMAPESKEDEGFLQTWLNLQLVVGRPSLSSLVLGPRAVELETLSDEDLAQTVLKQLYRVFGEDKVSSKKLVRVLRSSWNSDEWSMGVGSYPTVGSVEDYWSVFAKPLCPHVFFAGEHTIFEAHSSVHGAFLSGIRAAKQVLDPMTCKFADLPQEVLDGKDEFRKKKKEEEEKRKAESEKKKREMKRGSQPSGEGKKDEL